MSKRNDTHTIEKNDSRILIVNTTQAGALKQVVERILNVISDCCIVFIPPDDIDDNITDDYYESESDADAEAEAEAGSDSGSESESKSKGKSKAKAKSKSTSKTSKSHSTTHISNKK